MKTKLAFCVFSLCILSLNLFSQGDEYDPFEGNYTLLKAFELGLFLNDTSANMQLFYDNNEHDSIYKAYSNPLTISKTAKLKDIVTGDYDGDELEELVACYYEETPIDTNLVLVYYNYNKLQSSVEAIQLLTIPHILEYGQVIVEPGNFDDDVADELVLAYVKDKKTIFSIYDISNNEIKKLTSLVADTLNIELASSARFDITCCDFNSDETDEIVLVKSTSLKRENTGRFKITCGFMVEVYEMSGTELELHQSSELEYINYFSGDLDHTKSAYLDGLHIVTGDFDNNGLNEAAFGFTYKADYQRDPGFFYYEYRNQHFWTVLMPLRITGDLSIEEGSFTNINNWLHSKRSVDGTSMTYGFNTLGSSTLLSSNLNNYGGDEIIFSNARYIIIVGANSNLELVVQSTAPNFSLFETNSYKTLDVGSMFFDTSATTVKPHLVTFSFAEDPYNTIANRSMPFFQSNASIRIFEPVFEDTNKVENLELLQEYELTSTESLTYLNNNLLAMPDFNGGYQLGNPVKTIKNLIQPTIIINAPPTHFDKLEGLVYDVNFLTSNEINPDFYTQFITSMSSENVVNTALNRSWGVSASATGGFNIGLYKVKATVQASYGQDFAESNTTTEYIQVTQESTATTDDKIYGLKSEYHVYEYPVFVEGEFLGNMLSSIPVYDAPVWKESKNSELVDFVYTHEPGNIMSYPYYEDVSSNPNILSDFNTFVQNTGFSISNSSNESWTLEYSTLEGESIEKSASFGLSVGVKASGIGWSASVRGDYDQSNMTSHSTTIGKGFMIKANFDKLDDSFGETGYTLYPYLYWSKCGALVLDYKVDINPYNSWWSEKYGNKPDLAFILPWRLDPEKDHNLTNESKRMLTSDIRIYPSNPQPNDTATITITLRNFSLMDNNNETLVRFYHGDPKNGGKLIADINGESIKYFPEVEARKMQTLSFDWVCPDDLNDMPWVFAVIDPDNLIDEVHEDNNTAFAMLNTEFPEYIRTEINETAQEQEFLFDIYPNPAGSDVSFSFLLEKNELITVNLYNNLGQKIETLFEKSLAAGTQNFSINIEQFPIGIYYCQVWAGNKVNTQKLVIMK